MCVCVCVCVCVFWQSENKMIPLVNKYIHKWIFWKNSIKKEKTKNIRIV